MRSVLRKLLATVICLLLLSGIIPVSAEETAIYIKSYTLPSYASSAENTVTAGDVNNDGKVNNKDLTRLFQYLSDWDVDVKAELLDINGDSKVNNKDLTRLFQFLSDWEVEIFPQVFCDHDGDTEIRGAIDPTCDSDGYTGDTYCLLCNTLIAPGETVPATGRHKGGTATYYQKAICEDCDTEYGDYTQMSAYECLNESQQGIYDILLNMVYSFEMGKVTVAEFCGDFSTYEDDITLAFRALSCDRPDMFWMPRQIYIFSYSRKGAIVDVKLTFNPDDSDNVKDVYGMDEAERDAKLIKMNEKIDEILALTANLNTNFEKEILIHDYLCGMISYDYDTADTPNTYASSGSEPGGETPTLYNPLSFTAYGALVNKLAVCEGYSRAMQLICQKIGIPCGLITGYTDDGKAHMWNIINPGDGCYYLDVTFDDTSVNNDLYGLPCVHTYFNRTKLYMEDDHTFDDLYEEGVPLDYYDEYDGSAYTIEYNFFYTHGDNTALEYYTATGAYIASDDAESAANYTMYMIDNGYRYVVLAFEPAIGHSSAYNAIRAELRTRNIELSNSYNIINKDAIIIQIKT